METLPLLPAPVATWIVNRARRFRQGAIVTGLLILPEWLIVSAKELPRRGWGVRVVGDTISAVGSNDELTKKFPDDQILRADGQVLSPGFVNAHTHLYGVLAHGIPLSKAPDGFWPFLKDFWWPLVEDRIDLPMLRAATEWQCQQMLRSGVTSFYDCLEAPNALPGCLDTEAEVVSRLGLRAILSFEATQRVNQENGQLGLQENYNFARSRPHGDRIQGLICFHTTFTCSAEFIQQAFRMAEELDCLVHMHLSEGTFEPQQALEKFGMRPVQYYEKLGVLGSRMLASQCVQLDPVEVGLLAKHGVRAAHMPLSNCEVGGGIAPVPQMAAAGVTLGLGSDSYIDNFFEVMRGAFLIHKANGLDPRLMPADLVYYLATVGGARALNLQNVGRIEPGWKADLQLIASDFPTPAGEWNLYDQLILYRNPEHVRTVMVDGRILLRDGELQTDHDPQARQALHAQSARLWKAAQ
jgi:5-methylthioadenosine/S-adenosylhomocysteine deaminase